MKVTVATVSPRKGNRFINRTYRFRRGCKNSFGNKEGESSRQKRGCYNCGEEGHFIGKCTKPKENKAFVGRAWSDSEDGDEPQDDANCLMAIDYKEGLGFSKNEKTTSVSLRKPIMFVKEGQKKAPRNSAPDAMGDLPARHHTSGKYSSKCAIDNDFDVKFPFFFPPTHFENTLITQDTDEQTRNHNQNRSGFTYE
ncbi:putative ribonuclease H-like domain-containing protein [Tanacetum coccineum]